MLAMDWLDLGETGSVGGASVAPGEEPPFDDDGEERPFDARFGAGVDLALADVGEGSFLDGPQELPRALLGAGAEDAVDSEGDEGGNAGDPAEVLRLGMMGSPRRQASPAPRTGTWHSPDHMQLLRLQRSRCSDERKARATADLYDALAGR